MTRPTSTEGRVTVTRPGLGRGNIEGEAFIEVHADPSPFPGEAERGIKAASEAVEDDLETTGDKWGETIAEAAGDRLEKEGPQLARSLERGLDRQKVTVKTRVTYDKDNNAIRRFVETTTTSITRELTDAFSSSAGSAGFGKIGQAISDAIGAGFNVSGRSPLIAFLIPLVGAIIGLVAAAIQAVNALVAVLVTVPGILAAIGFQVGVLLVAFQGVGTAIQGAFAAKNAKELKAALKDLAPAAQDFVKSLLPIKDFFYQLRLTTQQNFFKAFGDDLIPELLKFQGNRILGGFQQLATALGKVFHDIGFFFNSNSFATFLDEVFPRTVTFLEQFGPSFVTFLEGLVNLANAAMPFMTEVGGILSMTFKQLGDFFTETANDPEFQTWLSEMRDTLDEVVTLIKVAFVFVGQLMDSINQAGGEDAITTLATALALIGDFLASDVGIASMKLLIFFGTMSIAVIAGLIIAIMAITGMLEIIVEFLVHDALPAIGGFFVWLWERITEFGNKVAAVFMDFVHAVEQAASGARTAVANFATQLRDRISTAVNNVIGFFRELPDRVRGFFADAGNWLIQAGRNLIGGLIQGVKDMFGPLGTAMFGISGLVASYLPHSPAKRGPLSGEGDPLKGGQEIITRLAAGMEMEAPRLQDASMVATSNITFGPNSIQMRFTGMPNQDQAAAAGGAVAQGIYSGLARDTRLAVRTL